MKITKDEIATKYKACADSIDASKICQTCKHEEDSTKGSPCEECYNTLMVFPVDPTKWEKKP